MKFRNTLILFGIVIVLFLFVYIFEVRKPEGSAPRTRGEELGKKLLVEKDNVSKIELAYGDPAYEGIACSKDSSGQWQVVKPVRARADQKAIDRLISDVISKSIYKTLKKQENLAEYGLDKPRVTAMFQLKDGATRMLMVGDTVPTGNYVYVKQKSASDVFLVPASMADELTKYVSDIRDRTVIALNKADITKIQLKYAGQEPIICEKVGAEWNLVKPLAARADTNAVDGIISALNDLKVDRFANDNPDGLSAYGLSQPQIEVTVSLKDGGNRILLIGRKEDSSVYVKTASDKPVFLVNMEIVSKLTKRPSDLRDRTVMAFDKEAVEKLELKYPAYSVVCEKKTGEGGAEIWELITPIKAKADSSQIDGLLQRLYELRADEFVSDKIKDLVTYGLAQPQIQIRLSSKEAEPKTLLIGKKSGQSVYVKAASSEAVCLVNASIVNELSKKPSGLRDRQVMKFKTDDVKRVELRRKEKTIACVKQERDWRLVEPTKEKAKSYEVNDILNKLEDLKAEKFAESAPLSKYGIDQPRVEVVLTFKDNSVRKLLVGSKLPNSESAYAKTDAEDVVFVIEKSVVDELMKDVDDIREKT